MVKRHSYPTRYPGCEISVATERMKDGKWSVVATIEHQLGDGVQATPLPVTHLRFDTEEEAHAFGMAQATEYLDRAEPAA
jgi:uncharacterized protein DUF6566